MFVHATYLLLIQKGGLEVGGDSPRESRTTEKIERVGFDDEFMSPL